jgi:hypothetical protein
MLYRVPFGQQIDDDGGGGDDGDDDDDDDDYDKTHSARGRGDFSDAQKN